MAAAQIQDPPLLGTLLDSIVRRLPLEVVWSIVEAPEPAVQGEDPIGELLLLLRANCRKRLDEPEYNEETKQALRDMNADKGLVRHGTVEDFFAAHGLQP